MFCMISMPAASTLADTLITNRVGEQHQETLEEARALFDAFIFPPTAETTDLSCCDLQLQLEKEDYAVVEKEVAQPLFGNIQVFAVNELTIEDVLQIITASIGYSEASFSDSSLKTLSVKALPDTPQTLQTLLELLEARTNTSIEHDVDARKFIVSNSRIDDSIDK